MLFVFSPILVADSKIICGYYFTTPLEPTSSEKKTCLVS